MRAKREDCVLLIIDVQERLIDTISQKAELVKNIKALIKTAKVLHVPILMTEQEKLGRTIPELEKELPDAPRFQKLVFSCCELPGFIAKLRELEKKTAIVCGIEAHICVLQTSLDMLQHNYLVYVPKDATSSHTTIDGETAVERMRDSGATVTTTEALIYELAERAGTEEFRSILEVVKERRNANSFRSA